MIPLSGPPANGKPWDFRAFSGYFSMSLSPDQVQRIAQLARIAIGPDEVPGVADRLNRVLGLIDQLQALDTRGIEPMSHALDVVQRLRPDAVTDENRREAYLAVAPAVENGLYLVPKVIE